MSNILTNKGAIAFGARRWFHRGQQLTVLVADHAEVELRATFILLIGSEMSFLGLNLWPGQG